MTFPAKVGTLDLQREGASARQFDCLDFCFRVSENLRLSGHQDHRERRVVLPGPDEGGGEGDRGQRCRERDFLTSHLRLSFHTSILLLLVPVLSTRGQCYPAHGLFLFFTEPFHSTSCFLFLHIVFLLRTCNVSSSSLSPRSAPTPSPLPVSPSAQASFSWTRAAKSSSPRASPSPSPSSSPTAATRTTPPTWRRSTSGSLRKRPTPSST